MSSFFPPPSPFSQMRERERERVRLIPPNKQPLNLTIFFLKYESMVVVVTHLDGSRSCTLFTWMVAASLTAAEFPLDSIEVVAYSVAHDDKEVVQQIHDMLRTGDESWKEKLWKKRTKIRRPIRADGDKSLAWRIKMLQVLKTCSGS